MRPRRCGGVIIVNITENLKYLICLCLKLLILKTKSSKNNSKLSTYVSRETLHKTINKLKIKIFIKNIVSRETYSCNL